MYRNDKFQGDIGKALMASATHLYIVVRDETGRTMGTSVSKIAGLRKLRQMIRSHTGGSSWKIMAKQAGE